MKAKPHDRFSTEVQLTLASVSAFAHNVGDLNPVHHDPHYTATTRYQRLIASGAHTTGLLMGLTATHFSQEAAMVGLEFWFRFRRPVFADETIRLEWLVFAVRPNARLGGDIVDLRGRIRNQAGETAVGAKGRVLVAERL
jgi:3-hydroxybutyryl-CoA dehydratase